VNHYDQHFNLKLTADQKRDLIEYLKSLRNRHYERLTFLSGRM
jgi:hypothetical protein